MIIKSKNLCLRLVDNISEAQKEQQLLDEDVLNMTEVKLYPSNLPTELIFEIVENQKIIGELKLKSFRWFNRKAEVGIFIHKEFRKRGLGKEALQSIISYCFKKLNLHRLEVEVIEFNSGSIKLIEELGFVKEGRLREAKYSNGKYYDVLQYGILKNEFLRGTKNETKYLSS